VTFLLSVLGFIGWVREFNFFTFKESKKIVWRYTLNNFILLPREAEKQSAPLELDNFFRD
jgi:hypothetical protein